MTRARSIPSLNNDGHSGKSGGGGGNPAPMDDLGEEEIPFVTQADVLFQTRSLLRRVRF
ncbi:single-stranded DNA-binding protein [Acidithiobacillus thiooxidans ATCC 19377]|uniref:Single-stranded DNA-binding protein n=1 Tax=Acidithiobacillus thiooxidans ATCC 19377 TaxID=637390 RepID=A0A5P9XP14_ACITH|nr:single-stranded DNA-binding protein [Acidithiobacillus thiooxidans ATCC 19377]